MALSVVVFNTVVGLLELVINVIVRSFGFSEIKAEKIVGYIGWFLAFILVIFYYGLP